MPPLTCCEFQPQVSILIRSQEGQLGDEYGNINGSPENGAELGFFHVISAFCATGVPQNAEIIWKTSSSTSVFITMPVSILLW